tara:strand:- start:49 stop:534 length:486 start_codon:yes stop_codon:yes gene_type:complete
MGRRVKNRSLVEETGVETVEIPKVNTNQRPTGQRGQLVYNKTTNTFQAYIGTGGSAGWFNISTAAGEKTITVDTFQGDGSTTVFGNGSGNTLDGSTAANLSVEPTDATDLQIFIGGVYQVPGTNYTYSGGAITFGSAPPANNGTDSAHIIAVIHNLHKLGE